MGQLHARGAERGRLSFAALMLGHASQGLAFTAFTPALAQIAQEYGATGHGSLIAELTVTIASAGVMVGALVSGWVIARLGLRTSVLISMAIYTVAGSGGLFLTNAALLLASRTVLGFSTACLVTACISTIAARYEPHARARAIGASAGAGSATALAGVVIGGALAQAFGWRTAFVQYPVFGIIGLILAFVAFPKVEAPAADEATPASRGAAWRLWPVYLLTAVIAAVMFVGSTQFPFMLGVDGFKSSGSVGLVMGAITLTGVTVSFLYGVIERRLGLQGSLALALVSIAAAMLLIGLVPTPAAAVLGAALQGVYVGISMPYVHHVVTLRAPPSARARAVGLLNAFNFFGALVNPVLFAPVTAAFGIAGLFVLLGGAMGVLAAGALVLAARGPKVQPAV